MLEGVRAGDGSAELPSSGDIYSLLGFSFRTYVINQGSTRQSRSVVAVFRTSAAGTRQQQTLWLLRCVVSEGLTLLKGEYYPVATCYKNTQMAQIVQVK